MRRKNSAASGRVGMGFCSLERTRERGLAPYLRALRNAHVIKSCTQPHVPSTGDFTPPRTWRPTRSSALALYLHGSRASGRYLGMICGVWAARAVSIVCGAMQTVRRRLSSPQFEQGVVTWLRAFSSGALDEIACFQRSGALGYVYPRSLGH